ncbi:PREDICTED: plastid division protein PDV1 [Fragaria vesca subsp. vesca]|uniref:plastid division protein PDV1 n=1 Tax=Fragaria vesca subsp. vesca TaxID=101020 RepID=UPI0002C3224D|nr:PREDICTED: plastid division protein PDV1 [Fragaria vesca subsp. vesca]
MKWDMEIEEIEAVLEKIWDLHDKLSDAIHSISRAHFLHSVKALRQSSSEKEKKTKKNDTITTAGELFYGSDAAAEEERRAGFVFVKDFRVEAEDDSAAIREAKSLNAIRTALENLEDQLEFFHTVQVQQRAERDAAIARLEQSRIVLALRLSEHHGKKYKVIEEALAFVGDVCDANGFVSPESLYVPPVTPGDNLTNSEGKSSNILMKVLVSSVNFAKKTLKLDNMGGLLGNAALVAVSMIALVHMQQVAVKEHTQLVEDKIYMNRSARKTSRTEGASSSSRLSNLDVLLARG